MAEDKLAVEQRRARIARLHSQNRDITYQQLADEVGVSPVTIKRDIAALRKDGRWLDPVPTTPEARRAAAVIDTTLDTYAAAVQAVEKLNGLLEILGAEVGFTSEKCPCCGRAGLSSNPIAWQSVFKGYETVEKHLRLAAQISGQLENQVYVITHADRDVETVVRIALKYDRQMALEFIQELILADPRRQRRMSSDMEQMVVETVEGTYRELPPGGDDDPDA
jgi:DNA-binding Lrp family transcriptional regulator